MAFIVAIAGGSGSGKTTIARKLAALLGAKCAFIAEDDYYLCRTTIPDFDPNVYDFDAPAAKDHALLATHLERARRGEAFDKPLYDFASHMRLACTERAAPSDVVILDGLHVFATKELRAVVDLAVYIDAEESVRLARRLVRDVEKRGRSADSVYRQFFRTVRSAHALSVEPQKAHADLVLISTFAGDFAQADAHAARIAEEIRIRRLRQPP